METDAIYELLQGRSLDRTGFMPLSQQVETRLAELIHGGALVPGDKLPHEVAWSRHLGISRGTLRVALERLVRRGLVHRRKHAGTFVNEPRVRARNIGFFYFRDLSPFIAESLNHIQALCDAQGYDLKVVAFPRDFYDRADLRDEMRRRDLAGAVLVALPGASCRRQLLRLERSRFPYVRMGNKAFIGDLRSPLITGDDRGAARDALRYLMQRGHHGIGYVAYRDMSEACEAYLRMCRALPAYRARWLTRIEVDGTFEGWRSVPLEQLVRDYLIANPDITAVLTESSLIASALVAQARELGREIPSALSVLSLQDALDGRFATLAPAISAMTLSRENEARRAVERLLAIVDEGLPEKGEVVRIPFALVERDSVRTLNDPAVIRSAHRDPPVSAHV